jgi:NACalpha-BTF3-like transcription factor
VAKQARVSRAKAVKALRKTGNMVDAILVCIYLVLMFFLD